MIGLGAMGQGMAASLLRHGYVVSGYDMAASAMQKFMSHGQKAIRANSPAEAVKGAQVVVLMVQNSAQVDDILFGSGQSAKELSEDCIIILSSTVSPYFVRDLKTQLDALGKNISVVDAPVSGGTTRAANGTLTVCPSEKLIPIHIAKLISNHRLSPQGLNWLLKRSTICC